MRLGCSLEAALVTQNRIYEDRKERADLRCIKEVNIQRTVGDELRAQRRVVSQG